MTVFNQICWVIWRNIIFQVFRLSPWFKCMFCCIVG